MGILNVLHLIFSRSMFKMRLDYLFFSCFLRLLSLDIFVDEALTTVHGYVYTWLLSKSCCLSAHVTFERADKWQVSLQQPIYNIV